MKEYSLRIADDGTKIFISSVTENSRLTVYFQRINFDAEAISVQLLEITQSGAILTPFPAKAAVTASQEAAIHQALVDLLVS